MTRPSLRSLVNTWMLIWLGLFCIDLPAAQPATELKTLTMGFYLPGIRDANLTDVRVSLQVWAEEIGWPTGIPAQAATYNDMSALRRDVVRGYVDIVVAPGMELAEFFSPQEIAEGFVGRQNGTEPGLALIVAKSAGIRTFTDLRGKRLVHLSNDRLAATYLEVLCQQQAGMACRELFNLSQERRDVQSIHQVFFGKADAALVSLGALQAAMEMNPQVAAKLGVLIDWKTPGMSFGMMTTYSDTAFRERILSTALKSTSSVRGRQILEIFKTDYMVRVDKSALQPYWLLSRQHQDLLKTSSGKKK